jgi:hypothetical protein
LDPIQSYLQPLVQNHTLAGAVTLVANRDGVVYLKAVGDRDVAAKASMATDDMFWIASTSKPMTATAFMMLVDEGKINLNDPVEKYLPEFKGQMVNLTHASAATGVPGAAGSQNSPHSGAGNSKSYEWPSVSVVGSAWRSGRVAIEGCCAQFRGGTSNLSTGNKLLLLE